MAQLVLSVTWRHCNQLDTIEGGKEGGWQQQRTQFATSRPHLYQYNCKSKYFLFTNNSLGIALLQNYFNQPWQKKANNVTKEALH